MPGAGYLSNQTNVLIECGSASSFELSPRFANHPFRDRFSTSQDHVNQDLENEIQEAMSETIQGEESLDGKWSITFKMILMTHFGIQMLVICVLLDLVHFFSVSLLCFFL